MVMWSLLIVVVIKILIIVLYVVMKFNRVGYYCFICVLCWLR